MDSYDIPPPDRWEDFEHLCRDLWAILWDDPDTRRHGRSGQSQSGVDVYGRPRDGNGQWHGVQCKLKSQSAGSQLTRKEIVAEVEKAKTFDPPLAAFILATTAPRDVAVEEIVRQIAEEQDAQGSFPVTVRFWEDILEDLQGHEALLRKHYERWRAAGTAGPRISTSRLPVTGETFVARETELAGLDAAWEDGTNVLSFVATGGAGKSALINRWLAEMQNDGWRGADRVLGWSFYSQGTDSAGASSEAFTEFALDWLGYTGDIIKSPWTKGEVLARLVRERRTVLLLDGLEPLQHPPGPQTGKIKDPSVQALVRELAADNPGLCVIATRVEVADLAGRAGADSDLEKLPPEAGAELLRRLGVRGSENELRAASQERGGHCLALTLLGTYLRDICGGDVRRRNEVAVLDETAAIEGSDHARHVMEAYETWFGPGPELQILHLLGLFDRPAEPGALAALRAEPEIPGLTEGIGAGDETAWQSALSRLRQARLVAPAEEHATPTRGPLDGASLDTHPLVREHFGERLRRNNSETWRGANERLYEHYRKAAPDLPETLDEMLPLYAAVVHGCRAGKVEEAFDKVYWLRIVRKEEFFNTKNLGASGADLVALAAFFDRPWTLPSSQLSVADRAWILNAAGIRLSAMGRLSEAVESLRASLATWETLKYSINYVTSLMNLSCLLLTLGDIPDAIHDARKAVSGADKSGDAFLCMACRANLANALHQAGHLEESRTVFQEAAAKQAERQPLLPRLYSLWGYFYCDFLLTLAEPEQGSVLDGNGKRNPKVMQQVEQHAKQTLGWARAIGFPLDIALDNLSLGRSRLGLATTSGKRRSRLELAANTIDRAVDGLREVSHENHLPFGLVVRASLRRLADDFDGATADLREAQEIAERGSMLLHEADAHLEWTRLHLATGDPSAAREHLDRARELVRACGYGRREREVTWLEGRLAALDEAESA